MRFTEYLTEVTQSYSDDASNSDIARARMRAERNPRSAAQNEIKAQKANKDAASADKENPASRLEQQKATLLQRVAKIDMQISAMKKSEA